MKEKLSPYLPGIALFIFAIIIMLFTYKDYGVAWDEPPQRGPGILSYEYVFHGNPGLFLQATDNHGAGYELPLAIIEKWMHLTDKRDIYLMRHVVTHILFLVSALALYVLALRLFKNKFIASLGFVMLAFTPRLYAHSYFNSKDLPFLSMMIISLAFCRLAFAKNKPLLFLFLGLLCGYATSIRIMGIMLGVFIYAFLVIDMVTGIMKKEKPTKSLLSIALFTVGFFAIVYAAWPYLWRTPVKHFTESFTRLSHFDWNGSILMGGTMLDSTKLPWTYFPTWFLISNPELWLIAGFAGLALIAVAFFKNPIAYITNTRERNFILHLACFIFPIFAVLAMHSIIYDDWRHLYFIYPSFVIMALYAVNWAMELDFFKKKTYRMLLQGALVLQALVVGVFMVQCHPFQQVYFNHLVSHDEEYLRKNYEMDYWGVSNLQALKYIADNDAGKKIYVSTIYPEIMQNNLDFLEPEDRDRLQIVHPDSCQYFITNFRFHPDDFPFIEDYSFKALNSTVIRIYTMKAVQIK